MKPRRIWLISAGLLALIWSGVAGIMHQTDHLVSWPEKVMSLAEQAPWIKGGTVSSEARRTYLDRVITSLNRLDVQQRRRLREEGQESVSQFFTTLTPEEQKEYVDRTIEPYLKNLDRGLNLMPKEERKKLTARLRGDVKGLLNNSKMGNGLSGEEREFMETMIAEDPVPYLRDAPLNVKMEMAPFLEDMEARIQGFRR